MRVAPATLAEANAWIEEHHAHHHRVPGMKFAVKVVDDDGKVLGVAVASRPVSRKLDDGLTLEVTRLCTDRERNAGSMLLGSIGRAAQALGYHRLVSYTMERERGTVFMAAGWKAIVTTHARSYWQQREGRQLTMAVVKTKGSTDGCKVRWERLLLTKQNKEVTP